MASNRKKDRAIQACAIISIVLCVIAAAFGFLFSTFDIGFQTERSSSVYISSASQISSLGKSLYNDRIYLTGDITVDDANLRIGTDEFPFEGVFDGQGYTIHLTYKSVSDGTSLFGYISPAAVVRNVNFVFDDIVVEGSTFGGIAKINDGVIENCTLTYNTMEISGGGMFSPLVTINRGRLSHVVVSGKLVGKMSEENERDVFFGNVCVYNLGSLKSAIAHADFAELNCTDELNILKGLSKNIGISALRYSDSEGGTTVSAFAILPDGQITTDKKTSKIEFSSVENIYTADHIFNVMDFNNKYWSLDNFNLSLTVGGKK